MIGRWIDSVGARSGCWRRSLLLALCALRSAAERRGRRADRPVGAAGADGDRERRADPYQRGRLGVRAHPAGELRAAGGRGVARELPLRLEHRPVAVRRRHGVGRAGGRRGVAPARLVAGRALVLLALERCAAVSRRRGGAQLVQHPHRSGGLEPRARRAVALGGRHRRADRRAGGDRGPQGRADASGGGRRCRGRTPATARARSSTCAACGWTARSTSSGQGATFQPANG